MSTPPILASTDFSAAAECALRRAAHLARALERPLHLLHVYNEFTWTSLRALLAQPPGFDLRADLAARLRAGADLLVIGRHGRSALEERLLGSVALNLLHHAPCDVLLAP